MAKLTLTDLANLENEATAVANINANNTAIEQALDNTLSRNGTSPNQMGAVLDMNSNRIINLPVPQGLTEPLRLADAATLNGNGTIAVGTVPNGGITGQVLSKASNTNQDTVWTTPHYLPAGGSSGQVLTKSSASDYAVTWSTPPTGIPNGGTTGQVLSKNSNTDQDIGWASVHNVPAGGTTGQVLAKTSGTDYATAWSTLNNLPSSSIVLATFTSLASQTVAGGVNSIIFLGYYVQGDTAPFTFKRLSSTPVPSWGCSQSADGAWWKYVPDASGIDVRAFGVKADWVGDDATATDDTTALQTAIYFAAQAHGSGADVGGGMGIKLKLPPATMMISSMLTVLDGCMLQGHGVFSTVLKMKNTFSTTSHFIRLGTPGDATAVCLAQSRGSAGNLTLNGTRVISGVSYFFFPTPVSITSVGNDSAITFTVHGTDRYGNVQSDTFSGANAGTVLSPHYFATVDSVITSGATAGNVTVGYPTLASFGCMLNDLQLFSTLGNGAAGTAMVYTNNAQHEAGLRGVKIFAGNRAGTWFETGIGGASYFTFDGVETFNTGDAAGNASNNPQMYFNYAALVSGIRNVICGGPQIVGNAGIGIQIDGGCMLLQNCHCEGMRTGILTNIRNINNGTVMIQNYVAGQGPWMVDAIKMDTASTPTAHLYVSGIFPNGSTNTINDARTATLTTGNITTWTLK